MNEYNNHPKPLVIKHRDRFKFRRGSIFWTLVKEPDHTHYPALKGSLFKEELEAA